MLTRFKYSINGTQQEKIDVCYVYGATLFVKSIFLLASRWCLIATNRSNQLSNHALVLNFWVKSSCFAIKMMVNCHNQTIFEG